LGPASITCPMRVSIAVSCSSRDAVTVSPSATSSGSRNDPTSTSVTGQPLRSSSIPSDDHSTGRSMLPSDRAPPTGPQGAIAFTHRSLSAAASPSSPSSTSNRSAAAASWYSGHWDTVPSTTSGGWVQGRSTGFGASPGRGAAARPPAERPSHPSAGQVFEYTDRTERAAEDPSRRSTHRFGVVSSETSDQLMPPVPTTTTAPAGSAASAAAAEAAVSTPSRNPASTVATATVTAGALRNTVTGYETARCDPNRDGRLPQRRRSRAPATMDR
jgi:hypothetical protein